MTKTTTLNLDGIAESARQGTRELAALLQLVFGDDLLGLTVFGSAATADFGPRCRVRSIAVLRKVEVRTLAQLSGQGARLGRHRVEAPLIATPQYVQQSLDAFPVEFLEIHQVHYTVLGEDIFAEMDFRPEDLRLQCEREFKRMLIRLRQGLLASEGKPARLGELLGDLRAHATRVLRGVLWLHGDRRSLLPGLVWAESQRTLDLDLSPLAGRDRADSPATLDDVERAYRVLEKLAERADAMG